MINIVCDGLKYICMDKLYEYDFGQSLQITGLTLTGPTVEAHFCIKGNDDSVLVMGTLDGDVAVVPVPNSMLEDAGLINTYIYERNDTAGKTVYKFELRVERRADLPAATYDPTEEEVSYFTHVIEVITEQAEIIQATKDELLAGLTIGDVETLPAGSAATADLAEEDGRIKLDLGIPQGEKGEKGDTEELTIDTEISATSTNPVQNKVISGVLTGKADKTYVDTAVQNAKLKNIQDGAGTGAVEEGCLSGTTVVSATGQYAHAEGMSTKAQGARSHAEGGGTTASGSESHAEGAGTKATADSAHAEGGGCTASGNYAHAEGSGTTASGQSSHAEGAGNTASGANAHAEGNACNASGDVSHAEGIGTKATAQGSHAEGNFSEANGRFSHAGGLFTKAQGFAQTVIGEYNVASGTADRHVGVDDEIFIIGNGDSSSSKSNAHTTSKGGVGWYQTDVKVGGTGHTNATVSLVDMKNTLDTKASTATATQSANGLMSSADKTKLDGLGNSGVSDVQVNGTSVVTDGAAKIPIASANKAGVVKIASEYGVGITVGGELTVSGALDGMLKNGNSGYRPVMPNKQHQAVFYGLAKVAGHDEKNSTLPFGTYTEEAKSKISDMLNGAVQVDGTTPTITALSGVRYVCGEVATLDITPCASGICDIVFTSGSTATVLTLPNTVKFPDGAFTPEANTTYEINIMDGIYGAVMAWT